MHKDLALIAPLSSSLNLISQEVSLSDIASVEIQGLIDRLFEIAAGEQGDPKRRTLVGLAAPQIGVNKRIILVGIDSQGNDQEPQLEVFINPQIAFSSAKKVAGREGCYSTDRVCGIVDRAESVTIHAYDRHGNIIEHTAHGFPARIFQHEIDHLDGIRFPDRITNPRHLHWVEPEQFGDYRKNWETWTQVCAQERWQAIKTGS